MCRDGATPWGEHSIAEGEVSRSGRGAGGVDQSGKRCGGGAGVVGPSDTDGDVEGRGNSLFARRLPSDASPLAR